MRVMSLLLSVLAIAAPLASPAQEPATNKEFRVDSDASWLRVLAYPDGPLRRFGHHHVISLPCPDYAFLGIRRERPGVPYLIVVRRVRSGIQQLRH